MNFLQYKNFSDFCEKNNLTPERALEILTNECKTRGILNADKTS